MLAPLLNQSGSSSQRRHSRCDEESCSRFVAPNADTDADSSDRLRIAASVVAGDSTFQPTTVPDDSILVMESHHGRGASTTAGKAQVATVSELHTESAPSHNVTDQGSVCVEGNPSSSACAENPACDTASTRTHSTSIRVNLQSTVPQGKPRSWLLPGIAAEGDTLSGRAGPQEAPQLPSGSACAAGAPAAIRSEVVPQVIEPVWEFKLRPLQTGYDDSVQDRIIGRSVVRCRGCWISGAEYKMAFIAFALITVPAIVFVSFTLPWFFHTLEGSAAPGVILYILAVILLGLTFGTFFGTACSDPGIIPRQRNPKNAYDVTTDEFRSKPPPKHQDVIINGYAMKLKFCVTCNVYRSPRTVHCSVCDNCVERFDHHCPWVGNCIGLRNYRRFYAFVFSTSLLVLFVFATAVSKLVLAIKLLNLQASPDESVFAIMWPTTWDAVILAAYTFIVVWFIVGLLLYHSYLLVTNQTTYEQIKSLYDVDINPFDRGVRQNIYQTLCSKARPRYFETSNLTKQHVLFEPRTPYSRPPVVPTERNVEVTATSMPTRPQQAGVYSTSQYGPSHYAGGDNWLRSTEGSSDLMTKGDNDVRVLPSSERPAAGSSEGPIPESKSFIWRDNGAAVVCGVEVCSIQEATEPAIHTA